MKSYRLKLVVPQHILVTLYNSLMLSLTVGYLGLLGDNSVWAVPWIILQCTDFMSENRDIPLKIHVIARFAS